MIKYNLKCENDHEFESWFSDSNEFERLKKKKLLECIHCSSVKIQKSIMAPMISATKVATDINLSNQKISDNKNKLLRLREYIEKNFEFVGDKFSEKVRDVYYDKNSKKSIYGTTTQKEIEELAE